MTYKVEYEKLDSFYESLIHNCGGAMNSSLQTVHDALDKLINTENIEGNTANRMREYMRDVHNCTVELIKNAVTIFGCRFSEYVNAFIGEVDNSTNARISSEELVAISKRFSEYINQAQYIDADIRKILSDVSPLYYPNNVGGYPGVDDSLQVIKQIVSFVKDVDLRVQQLESYYTQNPIQEIDSILDVIESYIKENKGHNSIYITRYSGEAKTHTYNIMNQYSNSRDKYIETHRDEYRKMGENIINRIQLRAQNKIDVELDQTLETAAFQVRVLGYIGDACISIGELAVIAFGAPKPAVDVVGGGIGGAWKGGYTEISNQLQSYKRGDGLLGDYGKINEQIAIGGIEGTASGLISVGTGKIFGTISEAGFVGKLTDSDNPVVKHTTKIGLKYIEKEVSGIESGISKRYIEAKAEEMLKGRTGDGRSAFEVAFDLETIRKEEIEEGGWAKTGLETVVSYTFGEIAGENKVGDKTSGATLESYDLKRTIEKVALKGTETILSESLGAGAKAAAASSDGGSRLAAGKKAVIETFTDGTKRERLFSETAIKMTSKAFDDIQTQVEEVHKDVESVPSLSEVMEDPNFFKNHKAGDYLYDKTELGKRAFGVLKLTEDPERDANTQLKAGGTERRPDDDGGHLGGARFAFSTGEENVDAQNRNLNRGAYKREENSWADSLQDGNNVVANIETYKREGHERPDAYTG